MANWEDKTVLITGGSAGLGLAVAKAFAERGANIVIVGRDSSRLESAVEDIQQLGADVRAIEADVTKQDDVQRVFDTVARDNGQLHVLVNAVGRSVRAKLESVEVDQYREMMEANLYSAIACTKAAMPMLEQSSGHIVNIGSLSSKTAWPFMAPYTTSKFALAGYTQQLRLEGPANVHFMLVCPGPIKRDDAGTRYQAEQNDLPEKAYKPGAGAKLKGLDPDRVAREIIKGCEKRRPEIVLPFKPRLLFMLSAISSRLGDWILRKNSQSK